jgi:pyruvate dehydrogenase E2 component (dihydrolipoamide acetyltransferase)
MAKLIRMPEVAANAAHAVLVEWVVKEGDRVEAGDAVAGIETDKAVVDLTVEHAGVVGRLLAGAGDNVAVGAPMAVLMEQGDSQADADALLHAPASVARNTGAEQIAQGLVPAQEKGQGAPSARILASPLARRLAAEAGLPLAGVSGTGPAGRVVKRDIDRAAAVASGAIHGSAGVAMAAIHGSVAVANAEDAYTAIPHSNMRRTIARRLAESKATVPHFYLSGECRVDALLALRGQFNESAPRKVSLNDFLIRAAACALRDVPDMNVTWTDEALLRFRQVDIGVAVATPGGLITPILRAAERQSVLAISSAMADLAERARASQLAPREYQGGTFGLSNLGMYGVQEFAAIINPPQSAILAIGAARQAPVVVDKALQAGWVMRYTLSVDHRAIDGAVAAQWLACFSRYLECPVALLV